MRIKSIKHISQTLIEAFQHCWHRFPITVGFVCALTAYVIFIMTTDKKIDWNLNFICGYYLSVGTLLSLSLHLWAEEIKNALTKYGVQVAAHGILLTDAVLLHNHLAAETAGIETALAHAAAIFAIWLSIFHMSFLKEKNDVASWNFTLSAISSYTMSLFTGMVLCGGLHLLLFSLNQLFGLKIESDVYGYVFALCCVFLNHMLFLGNLPRGQHKHDNTPYSSGFVNSIQHYIFLPLISGYLIVLYVYAARILVNMELPTGWVSWLVIVLMALCLILEFGIYPARLRDNKPSDNTIARWLPVLIMPLLILMTIGIVRRFCDYGITVRRLYLAALNAWFYMVCIGLFITRARRINWIPISLAVLFLLTSSLPLNFCSFTKASLLREVETEMKKSAPATRPLSEKQYRAWIASLPEETAKSMNEKLIYLAHESFGAHSVSHLINKDFIYSLYSIEREIMNISDVIDIDITCQSATEQVIEIPAGSKQFRRIPSHGYGYQFNDLPYDCLQTGILPVEVSSDLWGKDSIYFDLDTLMSLADNFPRDSMPHTKFQCTSENTCFILTGFQLSYSKERSETNNSRNIHRDIDLNIEGYLFRYDDKP